jgi:DsbC/DsbD-like thiol-disulfide interchange protein
MSFRSFPVALGLFLAAVSLNAQSIGLPGLDDGPKTQVSASLLSEVSAAAPGEAFRVAVKLVHIPGSHTYGKVLPPEIIGKPTKLIWTLPEGWKMEELPWPAVHPFKGLDGTPSEGYEGTVYLPAKIIPPANAVIGSTSELQVKVDGLVCDDKTCMPFKQEAKISLALAYTSQANTEQAAIFDKLPALEKTAAETPPAKAASSEVAAAVPPTFLFIMFSAFVGGLILNIMPCVFPVLGIKVVGVVQQAGEDRKQVVLHGLVYTLGVLVMFWALGGLVVALGKGWGFQLQSAGFNYTLAAFFLIFGLNMAGVFEIGASAIGVGREFAGQARARRLVFLRPAGHGGRHAMLRAISRHRARLCGETARAAGHAAVQFDRPRPGQPVPAALSVSQARLRAAKRPVRGWKASSRACPSCCSAPSASCCGC